MESVNIAPKPTGTPETLYRSFRALSQNERFTAARYILEDEEIRRYLKIPNGITLAALSEDRNDMPVFDTMDELREDLLG
uniref:Uncharacterized protein n=2 Tax=unclassified Candidatus Kentrum TaxID=2643149 RepID=A0A451APZ5_9GAMM|nr:MAG: hypothetical protein BECKLPF1236B_GA0070989_13915 [Candidatus Kentron sp. LPFa]VFK68131.1 MAG: hypothetical protein BECKUNK1418G_GA0071005_12009 [Candidatus Kentron sp. UNK]VFK73388.1 MAG: hypothetical protein BECKUNK1418H_GA0071006_11959 [Candidatus Kentron sp. UNK]